MCIWRSSSNVFLRETGDSSSTYLTQRVVMQPVLVLPSRHLGGIHSAACCYVRFQLLPFFPICKCFQTFDITPDLVRKTAELAQIQISDEEVRRALAWNVWRLVLYRSRVLVAFCTVRAWTAAFSRVPLTAAVVLST